MKEAELNSLVRSKLDIDHAFGYKISDVGGSRAQRRPFDGFGIFEGKMVLWESKLIKGLYAFNLKEVFEGTRGHQMTTFETFEALGPNSPHLWVILGCYIPRSTRVYVFDFSVLKKAYASGVTSLKKGVLETLPYSLIYKKAIQSFQVIKEGDCEFTNCTQ